MHFIYILKLTPTYQNKGNWDEETNKILGMHWNYMVDLHKQGIMQVVGRTDLEVDNTENTGIAIFKAENQQEAEVIMQNDPCVKYGVMVAKVHPFNLALMAGAGT